MVFTLWTTAMQCLVMYFSMLLNPGSPLMLMFQAKTVLVCHARFTGGGSHLRQVRHVPSRLSPVTRTLTPEGESGELRLLSATTTTGESPTPAPLAAAGGTRNHCCRLWLQYRIQKIFFAFLFITVRGGLIALIVVCLFFFFLLKGHWWEIFFLSICGTLQFLFLVVIQRYPICVGSVM